jgi:putative endonuclease
LLASLDWMGEVLRKTALNPHEQVPETLEVGNQGEELAYFHVRKWGYTVVAKNWRNSRRKGELDLVGWDGDTLCFIEVKTRTRKSIVPAEAAVHRDKMRELALMARLYLRQHPVGTRFRFDVVTVYLLAGQDPEVALFKDAFGWRTLVYNGAPSF